MARDARAWHPKMMKASHLPLWIDVLGLVASAALLTGSLWLQMLENVLGPIGAMLFLTFAVRVARRGLQKDPSPN